ncbi:MAG: leucyl aminopeptidase family protein [Gammaproteobacteria bacterium]|nr:leucyl aminopeptidase family protein [Gammaproteobacteria bacterium]
MIKSQLKLLQNEKLPSRKELNSNQHWLILYSSSEKTKRLAYYDLLNDRRKQLGRKKYDSEPVEIDLPNSVRSHTVYACVDEKISAFDLLTLCRKLVGIQKNYKVRKLGVILAGFDIAQSERLAEAVVAAAAATAAVMPNYKSKSKQKAGLSRLELFGLKIDHNFKRTLAEAEGNALARYLSILPPNELTPGNYLTRIRGLAKENKWKLEFYDQKNLTKKKAGAFLAVVQGSHEEDAGIVRLQYKPGNEKSRNTVCLVGKGICYDTGGNNLKPAKYMYGMHEDMQGSAVALGTFLALSKMQVDFPVECWLALAMNHIGPKAYKPNDVITASDGTTIEIVHTDAEGRMVLADTLALASMSKPKLIIDYATLTGACVYSLGSSYSGVFTNREDLHADLIQVGKDSGERVWPFPLDEDYDKGLESDIADVKQCALEGDADHILAARFLQRFVKNKCNWVHMDLASSNHKGGLAHIPTDTAGFGVRYSVSLLIDKELKL